ncbi:hypothetical protein [Leucobacter chromiireducens]|uniref:hypothetical protein n=1 Tax=Leucobacter chromiireducens TaxID=283877 RepID=UPI000F638C05|nr:hypothetical protein [Leucobacter chromiireducens]
MAKNVSTRVANARAAAEKAKRELAAIEREEREALLAEKRAAKALQARSGLAEEVYAILGIEPEPPRAQTRVVKKDGAGIEQTVQVDRDPREKLRAEWALEALHLMSEQIGEKGMEFVHATIERRRRSARDADDAARAAKARAAAPVAAPAHDGVPDPHDDARWSAES